MPFGYSTWKTSTFESIYTNSFRSAQKEENLYHSFIVLTDLIDSTFYPDPDVTWSWMQHSCARIHFKYSASFSPLYLSDIAFLERI